MCLIAEHLPRKSGWRKREHFSRTQFEWFVGGSLMPHERKKLVATTDDFWVGDRR
jgi:hypothetical protein